MKKQFQSNLDGMTLGGGSIQHPLSIHSSSIGTRWKPRGMQLICTLVLLFTFAIGNVWAADPTLTVTFDGETYDNYVKTYSSEGITLKMYSSTSGTEATAFTGNLADGSSNKHYFYKLGGSAAGYAQSSVVITATTVIDSIAVQWGIESTGSSNAANLAVAGWKSVTTLSNSVNYTTTTAEYYSDTKDYAHTIWQTIDVHGKDLKGLVFARQLKSLTNAEDGDKSISNFGKNKSLNVFGVKIWLHPTSGPVDPTASFSNGDYTIGGSDLDLSTLFTTNSEGTVEYSISDANGTGAALRADGKRFYATTAGTATVAVAQAATSAHNAFNATATITVAACETSISGQPSNASLKVGDANPTLSVTASNAASYAWKESSDGTSYDGASTLATTASFTPEVNDAEQTKYYYCEVTSSCSGSAVIKSNIATVTVEAALPPCATLTPATSGSTIAIGDVIAMQTGSTGGTMTAIVKSGSTSSTLAYDANGLSFASSGNTSRVSVELNHLMQVGTEIEVTLMANGNGNDRGLDIYNASGTKKGLLGWTSAQSVTSGTVASFKYTVVAGDGLAGNNVFMLYRNNSVYLQSLSVSNCGAELLALSSAVSVAGKATVTLSKSLVAAGGTATASYSDLDSEYEFDGWEITSGDATIADATAATAAITMGTTASTITLKLKAAGVKYAVHFDSKGGSAVADQSIDAGGHAAVPTAPTKFKYTFGGWSETDGGSTPADLGAIAITAEKTFYAIWTPKVCPTSGEIYSFVSDGTKAPGSNTYCPASGVQGVVDIATYATVSGGLAQGVHTTTSNNPIQIQTSTSAVKLSHADGYFRALLECPLQEGDTIKFEKTNKVKMAFDSLRTKVVEIASGTGANKDYYIVPATYAGEDTIMVYYGGSSVNLTALRVIRPAKYAVTFNMHGHGDAVDAQNIIKGGKVTNPGTPSASGWDFGGWYKTYVADPESYTNPWDFENDVVSAATELHAKWTEHVKSSDATLSSLTVNGQAITLEDGVFGYAFELPMGTTALPTIVAVANDPNSKGVSVVQTNISIATITVTAEDDSFKDYTINFTVATSKDIELVWDKSKKRCDETTPAANVLIAAMSQYLSASYTGSAAEGGSLTTGKTTGSKIIITAKPGYAFKAMGFYGKIEDGTCNFYNDGVVETIGTSTGDACYANVFSNDEVHEFVIELTGSNGVYIRNMQLTIIEACAPITLAWDEEPVEFEVGKSGYAIAATANNGGTVAYSSTDDAIVDVVAATGALTISGLGSATLKAATAEGDGTTYCANGGNDIEISKAVNTYYLVKFDAQNGDAADEVKYYDGDAAIALPADPTFAGYDFQGWFDAETGGNQYTAAITPSASITVYAQWVAQCAGATITTQPTGTSYLTGRTATALVCEATAGAGGALTYEWFTCDDAMKTNPVAATAMPSTAVAGTFYYFCKVMEEGCDVEAFSDVVTITVADKTPICLIATTVTGATAHGDVTGFLGADRGGDAEVNVSSSSYKMDKGKYIGVTLPDGYLFQEGDKVVINVKTVNQGVGFTLFDGKEGSHNLIIDTRDDNLVEAGANTVVLPAYAGSQSVYVMREDNSTTGNLNSALDALAVYRTSAPFVHKVTVAGVDGTPDNTNHVAIEVPFSTTDDALDAIVYDWVSNNDAWTATHAPVVANAWAFGVENTVTFADKDGDESVYYITISKAAASSDATLSALTVNGQAIALADGVFEYSFELPYGTTIAPTVEATPNHVAAVATVDPCTVSGATITVVPESGAGDQKVYTLTFTISAWKEVVIWDGSYMSAVTTSPDATTGLAWEVNGFGSISSYSTTTYGEKAYTKYLPSGGTAPGRYMTLTVPAGYVAKFYVVMASHSTGNERGMFIGSNLVKDPDATSVLQLSNNDRDNAVAGMSEIVGAGTWYINPNASIDFQEIRAYVRKGMVRNSMLGNGVLGTSCVDHNVAVEDIQGATFYELMGRDYTNYGKLAFDEIVSGELEAGVPYVFQAHGDKLILFYGETKVDDPVEKGNGMYGTFTDQTLTELDDVYYFAQRALWGCADLTELNLPANRAYVKLSEVGDANPTPAPGRRRITMNVNGEKVVTDVENLNASEQPVKLLINGQLFIIRGEKMFNANGQLVK